MQGKRQTGDPTGEENKSPVGREGGARALEEVASPLLVLTAKLHYRDFQSKKERKI